MQACIACTGQRCLEPCPCPSIAQETMHGRAGAASAQTQHVVERVMPVFLRGVEGELDKEAASLALTSAAETLRAVH